MKVTVAGTGYVGLVTAAVLAHLGHEVICFDVDKAKVDLLNGGGCPIYEPGLNDLLLTNKERLFYTDDSVLAYKIAQVIVVAVGTPEKADGSANLKYLYQAIRQIANTVESDCVVAIKSTVPVGTNNKLQQFFDNYKAVGVTIDVVSNPEFLAQGSAVQDMLKASRIVVGADSNKARDVMQELYAKMDLPMLFTDRCSAEMIKYASNNFLALKISYINEIANLCEIFNANIEDVSQGMGMDPRIGAQFLKAGIGYGGSCFPKDTKALHWLSTFYDNEIKTIKAAVEVNNNQKIKLIKKARKYYDSFEGLTVAVLGLAFKPHTDDLRYAPSIENIPILLEDGANVRAYDPVAAESCQKHLQCDMVYCSSIEETLLGADICFIFTEWNDIVTMDPRVFLTMNKPIILDGRNCFSLEAMRPFPLVYESIGRVVINNLV